jgi:hypothetical protein
MAFSSSRALWILDEDADRCFAVSVVGIRNRVSCELVLYREDKTRGSNPTDIAANRRSSKNRIRDDVLNLSRLSFVEALTHNDHFIVVNKSASYDKVKMGIYACHPL